MKWYICKIYKSHNRKIELMNNYNLSKPVQTVQLHKLSFEFSIELLHIFRFSDDLIWKGRLFQISGLCTFKPFATKVTWFHWGVSRLNFYCSLTNIEFSLTLNILFINSGFSLLIASYIFQHAKSSTYIHSFWPSLLF